MLGSVDPQAICIEPQTVRVRSYISWEMIRYPQPNSDELPELYEELDQLIEVAERALREHFHISVDHGHERISFHRSTTTNFLGALWDAPEAMVPAFQKVTGLSDREFARLYGERGIGNLKKRKSDFREEEKAILFANALVEHLPREMYLETFLYTFVKMWENDQRRHYRGHYENYVREYLQERGFANFKGTKLPGEPDFVIPREEPYEVLGEVRVIQPEDKRKRFREFRDEAEAAAAHFPDARFVALIQTPSYYLRDRREELRAEVLGIDPEKIDLVVFHDELGRLISELIEWSITRE